MFARRDVKHKTFRCVTSRRKEERGVWPLLLLSSAPPLDEPGVTFATRWCPAGGKLENYRVSVRRTETDARGDLPGETRHHIRLRRAMRVPGSSGTTRHWPDTAAWASYRSVCTRFTGDTLVSRVQLAERGVVHRVTPSSVDRSKVTSEVNLNDE